MTQLELGALPPGTIVFQKDLATAFDVTENTIKSLVKKNHLPAPFRVGKTPAWLAGNITAHFNRAADAAAKISDAFHEKVRKHTA